MLVDPSVEPARFAAVGHTRALVVVAALVTGACDDFSPQVGAELAVTCAPTVSDSYGQTAPRGCADAGVDAPSNTVAPDSGVTGNVLIADQYNNRVIEITRQGEIVWIFGDGSSVPGPMSIVAPNDAERLPNGETLMCGTGAPPGAEPGCSDAGCPDNRVLIVDDSSNSIWRFGADGGASGSGPGELSAPVAAMLVPTMTGDHVLITDQGNDRIIEVVRATREIAWQFPPSDATAEQTLTGPNSAERLPDGHTLIADEGGNRVVEVTEGGSIVWQYPSIIDAATLDGPAFASRLPSGNTLITDSNNDRILEIDAAEPPHVVWTYLTASRTTQGNPSPSRAVRLANGHTLITETFDDQIIEVDGTPEQNVVYTHGVLGVGLSGAGELNQAYDAKVVGDFTGLGVF